MSDNINENINMNENINDENNMSDFKEFLLNKNDKTNYLQYLPFNFSVFELNDKVNEINNLLEEFTSITEASNKYNISRSTISKVCLNKPSYKSAGGFIWKQI